jgi:hypothetical protein
MHCHRNIDLLHHREAVMGSAFAPLIPQADPGSPTQAYLGMVTSYQCAMVPTECLVLPLHPE